MMTSLSNVSFFGVDLRLLRDLEHQFDRDRGHDLLTTRHDHQNDGRMDLRTVSGIENLQQALLLRLLTHRGELAALGHPEYGSRLGDLIGAPNTPTIRNRAKLYTLEAVNAEPRVQAVESLSVTTSPAKRSRILIDLRIKVIGRETALNLVVPLDLEGGGSS